MCFFLPHSFRNLKLHFFAKKMIRHTCPTCHSPANTTRILLYSSSCRCSYFCSSKLLSVGLRKVASPPLPPTTFSNFPLSLQRHAPESFPVTAASTPLCLFPLSHPPNPASTSPASRGCMQGTLPSRFSSWRVRNTWWRHGSTKGWGENRRRMTGKC